MKEYMLQLGQKARTASIEMSRADSAAKDRALLAIADAIDAAADTLKSRKSEKIFRRVKIMGLMQLC